STRPLPLLSLLSQISGLWQSGSKTSGRPSQSLSVLSRQEGAMRRWSAVSVDPPSADQVTALTIGAQVAPVPSAFGTTRPEPVAGITELQAAPPQSALLKQCRAALLLQTPMSGEFTFMQNEVFSLWFPPSV